MASLTYRINSNDEIIYVSSAWDKFAEENQGKENQSSLVLKQKLWDFISDPETAQIYLMLVEKVRKNKKTVKVPFRCDTSEFRRFLYMEIKEMDNGIIEFNSILEKIEKREKVLLLEKNVERSNEFIKICSWCKKVYIENEDCWYEVEDAVKKMNLFGKKRLPMLTHTMCDKCFKELSE
ncbi:MAG: hypothetical protein H6680_02255 [Desulfobacteraceae bacterium]|nr:hypothetical protein [Desulfobacteraceae bacterium]